MKRSETIKSMKIESIRRRTAIFLVLGVASIFVLGASIFVLGISILPGAYAVEQFTNKSIEGAWGFSGSGTINDAPAVAVGLFTVDGNGGCSVKEDFNSPSGLVTLTSIACTYNVNPDGTANSAVTYPPPLGLSTFSFVIVDHGNEILAISTDPGVIARFDAKRQ